MRHYERASTLLTSNRPVDDWGKFLGDTAAVTALLDRLLHHAHVLKCGPRCWRTQGPNICGWAEVDRWTPPRVATRRAACQRAARVPPLTEPLWALRPGRQETQTSLRVHEPLK